MKKLFLMFILLTPLAIADERVEIFISPSYGSYRGQKKNNINQEVKNVIGSGVKISFEGKAGIDDNAIMGLGMGVMYNSLKVKGKDINNNSHFIILVGQRHGLCFPTRQKICIWRQIIKCYAHHFLTTELALSYYLIPLLITLLRLLSLFK